MLLLSLFHFILNNFNTANLNNFILLHCWQNEALHTFTRMSVEYNNYAQYFNIDNAMSFEVLFTNYLQHKLPKLGIFLDKNCTQTAEILALANEARIYTEHFHWLLYDNKASLNDLNTTFDGATFSNDADITYSMPKAQIGHEFNYVTYDVYNKGPDLGGVLNITIDKEIICNSSGCRVLRYLSELHKRSRLDQRRNLAGLTMRVATVITSRPTSSPESELLDFLRSQDDTKIDPYPRMGFHMRMVLKDMLNCNFSYIFSDRWSTDEFIGGIIGEIFNGTAELSSSPLLLTPQRVPYLRALTEVTSFRSICMFLTSRHAEVNAATFLAPFTYPVWCIYMSLLLLTGALLWLTFRFEHWHMKLYIEYVPSLLTTCVISLGAACIQGSQLLPRSIGGRMILFALMLTTFLIYNYYTSIVVSSLLGKPAQSNIKTIQQLADSPLEVAVQPAQYTRTYVEISTRSDIRSLYKKKVASKKDAAWLDGEEGVLRVRDSPGFVYITDAATAYEYVHKHYMPHQICGLNEIPLRPEAAIYMLVNRNMSYKELIKLNELRIMETGILRKHRDFWIRTKLHCYNSNELVNVHMSDIAPLIIMLVCGYGLAALALIGEILWQQQCERRFNLQSCH